MTFTALIDQYAAGPELVRRSVQGLSRAELLDRPIAGKWSTLEVVAHIADFEPVFAERMMRMISHERPLLMVADENLFAATLNYQERDLDEELGLIELTRKKMARILRSLPATVASRVGVHSFKGLVSLEAILNSATNHIPHHVAFIDEKRKALRS